MRNSYIMFKLCKFTDRHKRKQFLLDYHLNYAQQKQNKSLALSPKYVRTRKFQTSQSLYSRLEDENNNISQSSSPKKISLDPLKTIPDSPRLQNQIIFRAINIKLREQRQSQPQQIQVKRRILPKIEQVKKELQIKVEYDEHDDDDFIQYVTEKKANF